MAINVDTVYKTVLLILNKEQRGYMTPDEFNKTATQVQLDIFERYFDDLNQQLRVPQSDYDYSDRQMNIDENLAPFKTEGNMLYDEGDKLWAFAEETISGEAINYEGISNVSDEVAFYRLGTLVYSPPGSTGFPTELQRLQRNEFYNIEKSPLTAATADFPTYLYEGKNPIIRPLSITSDVSMSFIRKPRDVKWNYEIGNLGQFTYISNGSSQIELNSSEQVNVILRILLYSGIIIKDPQVVQAAASQVQQNEINKKS